MDAVVAFARDHPGASPEWRLTDAPIRFAEEGCDLWLKVGPIPDGAMVVRELPRVERLVVGVSDRVSRHAIVSLDRWSRLALDPQGGGRIALCDADGAEAARAVCPRPARGNILALAEAVRGGPGAPSSGAGLTRTT